MTSKIVVVGQGYVGLPVSMRAVEVGYDIVGLENDGERAQRRMGPSQRVSVL